MLLLLAAIAYWSELGLTSNTTHINFKKEQLKIKLILWRPREDGPRKKKARGSDEEDDDDAEQMEENYDELMRNANADSKPERELLPIKTKDGLVRRMTTEMIKKLKPEKAGNICTKLRNLEENFNFYTAFE